MGLGRRRRATPGIRRHLADALAVGSGWHCSPPPARRSAGQLVAALGPRQVAMSILDDATVDGASSTPCEKGCGGSNSRKMMRAGSSLAVREDSGLRRKGKVKDCPIAQARSEPR